MITYLVTKHKALELFFENPEPENKDGEYRLSIKQIFSDNEIKAGQKKPIVAHTAQMVLTKKELDTVIGFAIDNTLAKRCVGLTNEVIEI